MYLGLENEPKNRRCMSPWLKNYKEIKHFKDQRSIKNKNLTENVVKALKKKGQESEADTNSSLPNQRREESLIFHVRRENEEAYGSSSKVEMVEKYCDIILIFLFSMIMSNFLCQFF